MPLSQLHYCPMNHGHSTQLLGGLISMDSTTVRPLWCEQSAWGCPQTPESEVRNRAKLRSSLEDSCNKATVFSFPLVLLISSWAQIPSYTTDVRAVFMFLHDRRCFVLLAHLPLLLTFLPCIRCFVCSLLLLFWDRAHCIALVYLNSIDQLA